MFGYFTGFTTYYYWLLAQNDNGGSSFDLGVFGVAGTTIAILLYICRLLWLDNKELRVELTTVQQVSLDRVATIATQSASQLQDSAQTLQATTLIMNEFSQKPGVDPEQLAELNYNLRALREMKEGRGG
jgi:hypothetical protein